MAPSPTKVVTTLAATALLAAVVLSVGCTPTGSSGASGTGQALVDRKCSMCHTLDRVKQAQKDKAGWTATVDRMRGKGAVLSDSEAQLVVDYLAGGSAGK